MPDDTREAGEQSSAGVFGNLPASRPGTRSPRREGGGAAEEAPPEPPPAEPAPAVEAGAAPPPPPPKPSGPPAPSVQRPAGLEDLAWAGIAVAAQAATAGVRAASRALETVRKSVDRD
jgi:hypothetical protein